jgi:hypothetical protein
VLEEILQQRVVSSRGRRNPRALKRSVGKFPIRARCQAQPDRAIFQIRPKMIK